VSNWKVQAIMAVTADGWDHTVLRREQQDDNNMGPFLQELEEQPESAGYMAVTADGWDHTTLRREQQDDNNMGPFLQELEAGRHPRMEGHCQLQPCLQ
jgi:hypothetical protein